ncbi:MAG: hypothetical protein SWH61_17325 [Thermodesulfobacteriota bacterium]|nr:hypothetical protein [Thermodesulfobacteriota bacterium]
MILNIYNLSWVDTIALSGGVVAIGQFLLFVFNGLRTLLEKFNIWIISHHSNDASDPFLKYYLMAGFWGVFLTWIPMKFCNTEVQLVIIPLVFLFFVVLSVLAILWRDLTLKQFKRDPYNSPVPVDLFPRKLNYWPYCVLFGPVLIFILVIIVFYTQNVSQTQVILVTSYGILIILLAIARYIWQVVDIKRKNEIFQKWEHLKKERDGS